MVDINKVKTPFTTKQRSQLKKWSKFAKEEGLASPYARKVLYEAGSYNFIFVSRLGKLVEILNILKDHLDEAEVQDLDDCCSVSYGTFLNAKANEADPHTQYEKAKAIYYGDFGLEEDEEQALSIIKDLVAEHFAPAITLLGTWTLGGLCGLDENQEAGFKLLSEAGQMGDLAAWPEITNCLQNGIGIKKDPEKALEILKEKKGQSKELKSEYGIAMLRGNGVDANVKEGLKFLNDAAAEGDNRAKRVVAVHLIENNPSTEDIEVIFSLLESAAAEDDRLSLLLLGMVHSEGEIVEKNAELALSYLDRAAALDNSSALNMAGQHYLFGWGCEIDDEKAFSYLNRAVVLGEVEANYYLGCCYYNGFGTEVEHTSAFYCFKEAEPYSWMSTYYLGECYRSGLGVPKDHKKAFEMYLSGAEAGLTECLFALGRAYYSGEGLPEDDEEAVKWFSLAAAEDHTEAKLYLGICHFQGLGVPEDVDLGVQLIREAAQEGNEEAESFLHAEGYSVEVEEQDDGKTMIEDGVFTLSKDPSARARELYQKLSSADEISGKKTAQILSFRKGSTEGINRLMSNEEESED